MADPNPQVPDAPLIAYLRRQLKEDRLSFSQAPTPISGGFDTAIYGFALEDSVGELAETLILRIFRDEGATQARFEAAVQNTVADQGYPTPRMLLVCEDPSVLGSAFAIMPRLPGVSMLERTMGPTILKVPGILAHLHASLHALIPEPMRAAVEKAGLADRVGATFEDAWATIIDDVRLDGLRTSYEWISANRPPAGARAICHGDLHPLNVMMQRSDATGVLDWTHARIDEPAWDVGATVALLSQGPVDLAAPIIPIANAVRRRMVQRYLKDYAALRPLSLKAVEYYEAMRLLGFLIEVGTKRQAHAGVIPPTTKPTAFDSAHVLQGIVGRFTSITGVSPTLPAAQLPASS